MDFTIKPNTTPEQIRKAIGKTDREQLRESMKRREDLEKLATMHAGEEVYVQISGETAYADIASRSSRMGYTDRIIINVPAAVPDQVVTNLDDEVWDALFQKTELYHELGHVLYTDWPSFEETLFGDDDGNLGVPEHHRPFYKGMWNILEDATIERLLGTRFNIEDDLRVKNENVLRQNMPNKIVSLRAAVAMACMEYKHPTGWIDRLLDDADSRFQFLTDEDRELFEDEVLPVIETLAEMILQEAHPKVRARLVYGLYKNVIEYLDDADVPGDEEEQFKFDFADDAEENEGSAGRMAPSSPAGGDEDDEQGDESERGMKPPQISAEGLEMDIQRDYSQQVQQEKDDLEEQDQAERAEKWGRVLQKDYDLDSTLQVTFPADPPDLGSYEDATRAEAERLSNPIAKELRERLRKERVSKKVSGQKSGKMDSKRVHQTEQGKTNVFKRTAEPDEKDYACMIVLDRSGSMSSYRTDMTPEAEKAAGSLAYALEEVGVEVGQLSLTKGGIHLEKDLGEDVEQAKRKMFRGYNSGGTPLSDALALARGRLESAGAGEPFVIVITDGEPDHRERYRDQLHMCNFPVLGIYISEDGSFDEDHMNESAYFHHLEVRKYDEAFKGVRNMVKKVMF